MTRNKAREAGEIFECQPKIFYHALQVTTPKSQLLLLVKAGRVSLLVKTVKLKNLLFSNSTKWLKCGSAVVQAREDSKAAAKQVLEEHEVADQQARGSLTPGHRPTTPLEPTQGQGGWEKASQNSAMHLWA